MASFHLQHSFLSSFTQKSTNVLASKTTSPFKVSFSLNQPNAESSDLTPPDTTPAPEPGTIDPVKLAFEKAKAYKNLIEENKKTKAEQNPVEGSARNDKEVTNSVKMAMDKANEYKKKKGITSATETPSNSGSGSVEKSASEKEKLSVSSIDFMGLKFADKKTGRGLPPGLAPVVNPFPEGDLPDVEIIVGDTSNFGNPAKSTPKPNQESNSDIYRPKVSTWGVFPRPGNISKTYGGGRTIRPGDVLETAEGRAAKDERTKQLLAAYRKKVGLTLDPKLKLESEKALRDGDSLMDSGKLKEALPYYWKVMDNLPFQSELHGLAALQWSICQDSLSRRKEAQSMYDKLQSHPNAKVSKKARQFMFSFQAMEMMKVTGSSYSPKSTGYENYFDPFIEDKAKSPVRLGEAETTEGGLGEVLPYLFFIVSPIFAALITAILRGNTN